MKHLNAPVVIKTVRSATANLQYSSTLRSVVTDIHNADKYATQLKEIYTGSVHAVLMNHDPKAAVRIATLFAELCSTTGRARMRIVRIFNQITHGGAI